MAFKLEEQEVLTLEEYKNKYGAALAGKLLNVPEMTVYSRVRSGSDWRVIFVDGKARCALFDKV